MDALWYSLSSLEPLILSLPADAWEMHYVGLGGAFFTAEPVILRAPVEEEWSRFLVNAARVRELDLDDGLPVDYLRTMRLHLPTPCLPFPRLRSISLPGFDPPSTAAYAPMLLSPSLESFETNESDPDVVCAVLATLFDRCPNIRSLSIIAWNTDSVAFLPRFHKLQRVKHWVPLLASTTLSFLATSTSLTYLSIRAPSSLSLISSFRDDTPTFPNLATLRIDAVADTLVVDGLLRLVSKRSLTTLHLFCNETSHMANTGHMKTLLNTISAFGMLQDLSLTQTDIFVGGMPSWDLDPLCQLTSLKSLSITVLGYTLPSDFLRCKPNMPWANLKHLSLKSLSPLPPIDILGDCAHYLPKLERLTIPLNATMAPGSPVPRGRSWKYIAVRLLNESTVTQESWPAVAAYVAATYPNVTLVYDENEEGEEEDSDARWWNEVVKILPAMVSVAQAERSLIREGIVDLELAD
ncbi:hypothetical protein PsYK624_105420 [Phanerochaete sordida]|uniref:F-box domain-containing protein n=1 Tax=Phanerochaete sordida TaxID=48140 RepID=A0A9P3GG96_9APHY|nr:hypothetical protein PsYK624_105420 [Phanerochaete sordida]